MKRPSKKASPGNALLDKSEQLNNTSECLSKFEQKLKAESHRAGVNSAAMQVLSVASMTGIIAADILMAEVAANKGRR